jgi:hypothetical protein
LVHKNLALTPSGKIKRASASERGEWVMAALKKLARKTLEWSFKKCCIKNALDGTECGILWENSDLDCSDLKIDFEESVDLECETECRSEEDSERVNFSNLNFLFLYFYIDSPYCNVLIVT